MANSSTSPTLVGPTIDPIHVVVSQNTDPANVEGFGEVEDSVNQRMQPVDFLSLMHSETDSFVSKLYKKPKLPRQYIQDIITDVDLYVRTGFLDNLKQALLSKIKLDSNQDSDFECVFAEFSTPFSHVSTEYVRHKHFETSGEYIAPIPHEVGEVSVSVPTKYGPVLKPQKCFVQSIPIEDVLTKF